MSRRIPRRLQLKRETLQRLSGGDLARVAGGFIARCTYERSGCYGGDESEYCVSAACTSDAESNGCLI
jgi:hypothetical protein